MRIGTICAISMLLACCSNNKSFTPQHGDIIFQEGNNNELTSAIQEVTTAFEGKSFSHVGLVCCENDSLYVLEATFAGVVQTPYHDFLQKSKNRNGKTTCCVGRLRERYQYCIDPSVERAKKLLGKPYDFTFDLTNDCYYCSELLYACFTSGIGKRLFDVQPMTFKGGQEKTTLPAWQRFFEKHKVIKIPEGEPGLNPNSIAGSDKLEMVWNYGE